VAVILDDLFQTGKPFFSHYRTRKAANEEVQYKLGERILRDANKRSCCPGL
jgi:hypothetical protein